MINDNVYRDYRNNILIDKDNPVLAFKANRDRYFENGRQDIYAGLPHIGSINSEDAITWNFIRSLSIVQDFSSFEKLLKIRFNDPKVLLWTLSFDDKSNKLQYTAGSIIRNIDGKHKGQITEPDIIIETDTHLIVFECKLGVVNEFPGHLWESQKESEGPSRRKKDYFKDNLFNDDLGYHDNAYQLFRMVFYANEIASELKKKPVFVSLTNKSWWHTTKGDLTPSRIWTDFVSQVNQGKVEIYNIFWQDLIIGNDPILASYLLNHRCLKTR